QAEDGIRDRNVTGVQTCALPIFLTGEEAREFLPGLWKDPAQAVEKPLDLASAAKEDSAQNQREAALRVRLRVGDRQRAAPGAPEHDPAFHAQMHAQSLQIGKQIRSSV